jgi:hypothetical protein
MDKATVARRNRRSGKRVQKKVNELLGAKNVGLWGGEDGEHPNFSIEVKGRETFAPEKFMEQAEANCVDKKKIPIVVVHKKNTSYDKDIVMVRIGNFKKLAKEAGYVSKGGGSV